MVNTNLGAMRDDDVLQRRGTAGRAKSGETSALRGARLKREADEAGTLMTRLAYA